MTLIRTLDIQYRLSNTRSPSEPLVASIVTPLCSFQSHAKHGLQVRDATSMGVSLFAFVTAAYQPADFSEVAYTIWSWQLFFLLFCACCKNGGTVQQKHQGHSSWPLYSNVLYLVPYGFTWGAGPEMFFDTASFGLQNWIRPGFLLLSRITIRVILPVVGQLS